MPTANGEKAVRRRAPALVAAALVLAVAALTAAVYIAAGYAAAWISGEEGQKPPSLEEPSPEDEVARLNGAPVTAEEVSKTLAPARPHLDAPTPTDPRDEALDRVVRTWLFAEEAARRGIEVPQGDEPELVEAVLSRSLIQEELERAGADTATLEASITDEEVRTFYDENPTFFDQLQSVELYAIVVENPALAVSLLEEAKDATDEEFAALVAEHSTDRASRREHGYLGLYEQPTPGERGAAGEQVAQQEEGPPDEIDRVGRQLLEPGRVGLARGDEDGRYYVLRSGEVATMPPRGNDAETLRGIVKAAMVEQRQQEVLEGLQAELLNDAELEVDEQTLYKLPVPSV